VKSHEEFLMNFITRGGREQGAAFLQALVAWLDFHIDQHLEPNSDEHQKNRMMINEIEENIIGLTRQDWMRAKSEARTRVSQSLRQAIVARNRMANILDGFPPTCEVIYQLKRIRSWTLKGQERKT
jgi:hypothetical protein